MKKFLNILIVVIAFSFSSCEKDDICANSTPTTPRLVINFYDRENPDLQKNVSNLTAKAVGEAKPIIFNTATSATEITKYYATGNTISLPLRLNADETVYELTQNAGEPTLTNTDTIVINYTKREIYVSRACGYKTNFRLDSENPIQRPINDTSEWINNLIVLTTNIENENETHVSIYF